MATTSSKKQRSKPVQRPKTVSFNALRHMAIASQQALTANRRAIILASLPLFITNAVLTGGWLWLVHKYHLDTAATVDNQIVIRFTVSAFLLGILAIVVNSYFLQALIKIIAQAIKRRVMTVSEAYAFAWERLPIALACFVLVSVAILVLAFLVGLLSAFLPALQPILVLGLFGGIITLLTRLIYTPALLVANHQLENIKTVLVDSQQLWRRSRLAVFTYMLATFGLLIATDLLVTGVAGLVRHGKATTASPLVISLSPSSIAMLLISSLVQTLLTIILIAGLLSMYNEAIKISKQKSQHE